MIDNAAGRSDIGKDAIITLQHGGFAGRFLPF